MLHCAQTTHKEVTAVAHLVNVRRIWVYCNLAEVRHLLIHSCASLYRAWRSDEYISLKRAFLNGGNPPQLGPHLFAPVSNSQSCLLQHRTCWWTSIDSVGASQLVKIAMFGVSLFCVPAAVSVALTWVSFCLTTECIQKEFQEHFLRAEQSRVSWEDWAPL